MTMGPSPLPSPSSPPGRSYRLGTGDCFVPSDSEWPEGMTEWKLPPSVRCDRVRADRDHGAHTNQGLIGSEETDSRMETTGLFQTKNDTFQKNWEDQRLSFRMISGKRFGIHSCIILSFFLINKLNPQYVNTEGFYLEVISMISRGGYRIRNLQFGRIYRSAGWYLYHTAPPYILFWRQPHTHSRPPSSN